MENIYRINYDRFYYINIKIEQKDKILLLYFLVTKIFINTFPSINIITNKIKKYQGDE